MFLLAADGQCPGDMKRAAIERERARLLAILTHLDEGLETMGPDERDDLTRETTAVTRANIERRLAECEAKLAEPDRSDDPSGETTGGRSVSG